MAAPYLDRDEVRLVDSNTISVAKPVPSTIIPRSVFAVGKAVTRHFRMFALCGFCELRCPENLVKNNMQRPLHQWVSGYRQASLRPPSVYTRKTPGFGEKPRLHR